MEQARTTVELGRVEKKLSKWRQRHGGRGRPIPQDLWAAAAEVAAVAGVQVTARVLGIDRERLARRVQVVQKRSSGGYSVVALPARGALANTGFVEVDAQRVFARGKTVVRLTSPDGEHLAIEVEGGALDVVAVARAFWERAR
jgi:hypothetical protein